MNQKEQNITMQAGTIDINIIINNIINESKAIFTLQLSI